jgi:hypothetical protein
LQAGGGPHDSQNPLQDEEQPQKAELRPPDLDQTKRQQDYSPAQLILPLTQTYRIGLFGDADIQQDGTGGHTPADLADDDGGTGENLREP